MKLSIAVYCWFSYLNLVWIEGCQRNEQNTLIVSPLN